MKGVETVDPLRSPSHTVEEMKNAGFSPLMNQP
jgi:predicted TIM-barrel enzyme